METESASLLYAIMPAEIKRKTHTKSGVPLRTFYVCDEQGNASSKYQSHEARNAAPSAAARKLAKYVLPESSRKESVMYIRARGPTSKYANGDARVFSYRVKRSMQPVSEYIIENSQKEGYNNPRTKKPYKQGDKIPTIVAKSAKVSIRGGGAKAKQTKRRATASTSSTRKRLRGGGGLSVSEKVADIEEKKNFLMETMNFKGDCPECEACKTQLDDDGSQMSKFVKKLLEDFKEIDVGDGQTAYAAIVANVQSTGDAGKEVGGNLYKVNTNGKLYVGESHKESKTPLQEVYDAVGSIKPAEE